MQRPLLLARLAQFLGGWSWTVMESPLACWSESDQKAVCEQLDRILRSGPFKQSQRRQRFLNYLVTETLAGHGDRLKGYNIALKVFNRPDTFDPLVDPVVRIEAGRLREKLREYYETEGRGDMIRIELPKGSYSPLIDLHACAPFTAPASPEPPAMSDSVPPPMLPSRESDPLSRWPLRPAALVAAAAAAVLLAIFILSAQQQPGSPRTEKASVAVLPFAVFGEDLSWRRFADGMTEDITTDLSQSKDLFVVARHSTEVYRGKASDARAVGRDLGVHYLLEGSIQPSESRIKVTAQLIDARTGGHVWSSRYNRLTTDLFDVQRDVTEKIAATLIGYQGAVVQAERTLIRRKRPGSLTAYEHYLLGMEAKHGGASGAVTKEGLDEAERLFHRAIEIDPQLARAYVGLAYVYEYRMELGLGGTYSENLAAIETAARKAVLLDPNDGEAQLTLGHYFVYKGLEDQAMEQFARAEALAPSSADVAILIAWYLPSLDQPERASVLADRALQLNPNYPAWYNQGLRFAYFYNRQFDRAIKYTRLVPRPVAADHAYLAAASAMIGDMTAAKAAAGDVARANPDWSVEQYLTDSGGVPERLAQIFVEAARKAGVAACVPADRISTLPDLKKVKSCDEERAKLAPG
jgi:TolB-like protein/Tfp pilus assembly protein PilF